ncbi:hypothetical protein FRC04_011627 [Tulasnella sp. 424]|nr:hypothetical protein FRC04_011627 [Tulasnella sp. 424]
MLATIDGPKSLPREANLSKPLVAPTTELDTSKRRDSNASILMHRLPTEIFIYLITLVLADHCLDHSPWIVYTHTAELKLVCVLWAYRINSYPRFWNVLTNRLGPGHVSAVIRRSRAAPLHVDISFEPNQDIQTYITVIKSIAHRWSTLDISRFGSDNNEAYNAVLHDLLQVPAPQLQKLSLVGCTPTLPTTIRLFGGRAPLLHTATIAPHEWSIIRPIIPRLKCLAVEGSWVSQGQPSQLRLGMVIQALISSPEIEVIRLSNLGRQFAESVKSLTIPSSPILLARVRSVTLDRIARAGALGFFAAIRFPGDCAVNIDMHVSPDPGQLEPVLSMLYARFTQVVPLGVDIRITPSTSIIVLSYERGGAGGIRIAFRCRSWRVRRIKDFIDHVLRQLTEAIQASGISVHLRVGRQEVDGTREFPSEIYGSIVERVDGHLPSTTRASIYGLYFTEFITYANSGFSNLSELIIEERRIVAPWEQLVELAKSRSSRAADPAPRIAALEAMSLPSKGLDEGARERLSRVVAELNWTDDPHGTRFPLEHVLAGIEVFPFSVLVPRSSNAV